MSQASRHPKRNPSGPMAAECAERFVMRIADKLSDDPMLLRLLGGRFKVIADYDTAARRVTYSFRAADDIDVSDTGAKLV